MALVDRNAGSADGERGLDPLSALVPRAVSGDAIAVRALLVQLSPEMTRAIRAVLGASDAELDDAVQEALLGLLHALPGFRGECGLRHFANRIAVRAALHARRRSKTRAARRHALDEASALAQQATPHPTPDARHLAARRQSLWRVLLDELSEVQAETLALRVVLGFSLQETAEAMGVPVNTVRSRVRLAREALRMRIEAEPAYHELLDGAP